jgi:hypothetical protein
VVAVLYGGRATFSAPLAEQLIEIEACLLSHRTKLFLRGRGIFYALRSIGD